LRGTDFEAGDLAVDKIALQIIYILPAFSIYLHNLNLDKL